MLRVQEHANTYIIKYNFVETLSGKWVEDD